LKGRGLTRAVSAKPHPFCQSDRSLSAAAQRRNLLFLPLEFDRVERAPHPLPLTLFWKRDRDLAVAEIKNKLRFD
jgi:hypothetical protein